MDDSPSLSGFFICREYVTKIHELGNVTQAIDASAAASTDFDLTGQIVWLVSVLTSWYCGTILDEFVGKDVLELGAGAGLVGLVASQSAQSAVLSDYEPEVLDLLERNLKHAGPRCAASVFNLSWGSSDDHARLAAHAGRNRWDIIVGADIVYWSASIAPLFETVTAILAPNGVFILGYFNRVTPNRERVESLAREAGMTWTLVSPASYLPDPIPQHFVDNMDRMTIYRFTWLPGRAPAAEQA